MWSSYSTENQAQSVCEDFVTADTIPIRSETSRRSYRGSTLPLRSGEYYGWLKIQFTHDYPPALIVGYTISPLPWERLWQVRSDYL